jgi:hypothetical protein
MTDLSLPETRACEVLTDRSDEQLQYTFTSFSEETNEFDFVEYMVVAQDRMCYMVPKNFFIDSVLNEMAFREIL